MTLFNSSSSSNDAGAVAERGCTQPALAPSAPPPPSLPVTGSNVTGTGPAPGGSVGPLDVRTAAASGGPPPPRDGDSGNNNTTTNGAGQQDRGSTATPSSPFGFRAVIVGGGPGGLLMAHMLHRAGIDWVLLERGPEVVVESGASIAIWPQNARVLDQCGLLREAEQLYLPMVHKYNLGPDGTLLAQSNMLGRIEENHGYPWMLFDRRTLLDFLHRTLPGRETRVLVNKAVTAIQSTRAGVRVQCADGTSMHGSVVIGCDGVHSTVRRLMRDPETFSAADGSLCGPLQTPDDAMSAVFYGLVGHFPRIKSMPPKSAWEVHGEGLCVQMLVGQDDAYFFVYKRLPEPVRGPSRYTTAEADALAAEIADLVVCKDGITFGNVWAMRTRATIVNYDEGFAKEWHRGRMVLVSDACVKMTPNAALSLNTGLQGMVELTNRLRALLLATAADGGRLGADEPTEEQLTSLFADYQSARGRMAKNVSMFSGGYTRTVTWGNVGYRLIDRVSPLIGGDNLMVDTMVAAIVKRSIVLDFAAESDFRQGRVPWRMGRTTEAADSGVQETAKAGVAVQMRKRDSFHSMGYGVPA